MTLYVKLNMCNCSSLTNSIKLYNCILFLKAQESQCVACIAVAPVPVHLNCPFSPCLWSPFSHADRTSFASPRLSFKFWTCTSFCLFLLSPNFHFTPSRVSSLLTLQFPLETAASTEAIRIPPRVASPCQVILGTLPFQWWCFPMSMLMLV